MTINTLQLIGSFHQGGSERQAVQLCRLLKEDGRVNVFLATLNREGALLDEAEALGLPDIPEFPLRSFYDANFVRQVRACAKLIREQGITVVHTHDFYTNIFGMAAATLARVPLRIASKRETGGMRTRAQDAVEGLAFGRADRIVANSESVGTYLAGRGIPGDKTRIIYNGLDLERIRPCLSDRGRICEALGLPADDGLRFITLVANLRHDVKNVPMFIRAAKRLSAGFPDVRFVIAGEGELRPALERLAAESGVADRVHFLGRCTQVAELLAVSYGCVLTSRHEGFSNSILEYMAAGRPVVATDVGGAAEAVVEGETGFLVPSDDDEALAGRLAGLLCDPDLAARMGEEGRSAVEERFSCRAQLESTLALYGCAGDGR